MNGSEYSFRVLFKSWFLYGDHISLGKLFKRAMPINLQNLKNNIYLSGLLSVIQEIIYMRYI